MKNKLFNFSAGPAILPRPVLEKAREEMLSLGGRGMSVMEISHRSAPFEALIADAEAGIRTLLKIPEQYRVLFLQGGASMQFSMVAMNFLGPGQTADYVITGAWGQKALAEAKRCGNARELFSTAATDFRTIPSQDDLHFDPNARYIHYTSNETIEGVEFKYDLEGGGVPVICDASSNILSKPIDIERYAFIYAGAQKNIGPSGVTVVIIREDLLEMVPEDQHSMLNYRLIAEKGSMLNTPNTWGIYIIGLVCDWLDQQGGLAGMKLRNEEKAAILYEAIDTSGGFYVGHAAPSARSMMNVTFRLPSESLEEKFCAEATERGLDGLRGHRTVGGVRASIYNAFPREGVDALIEFMDEFSRRNG